MKSVKIIFVFMAAIGSIALLSIWFTESDVPIAVIDTGFDPKVIPEGNILVNRREVSGNKKDDDGNGYVDDVLGWNIQQVSGDTSDLDGHGTKVARAVLTANPQAKLIPVRVAERRGLAYPEDIAKAIRYAVVRGAKIIQCAIAVMQPSEELRQAITEAQTLGVVLVLAAGAGTKNPFEAAALDSLYPHAYGNSLIIGSRVTVSEPDPFANYGEMLAFTVTPAWDGSFLRNDGSGESARAYGSSFASAWVAGTLATDPDLSLGDTRALIEALTKKFSGFLSLQKNARGEPERVIDGEKWAASFKK